MKTLKKTWLAWLLVPLFFIGCATISTFDQYAYTQTTSIKVDAMNVMDNATDSYANHTKEIADVKTEIQKMIEYEKHRPQNSITAKMWDVMMTDKGLFGDFLVMWKDQDKVSKAFVTEAKIKIGENFDRIAELESKKIKP